MAAEFGKPTNLPQGEGSLWNPLKKSSFIVTSINPAEIAELMYPEAPGVLAWGSGPYEGQKVLRFPIEFSAQNRSDNKTRNQTAHRSRKEVEGRWLRPMCMSAIHHRSAN